MCLGMPYPDVHLEAVPEPGLEIAVFAFDGGDVLHVVVGNVPTHVETFWQLLVTPVHNH